MSEDEKKLLLLKDIAILELSNPKSPITPKTNNSIFNQNLFVYFS